MQHKYCFDAVRLSYVLNLSIPLPQDFIYLGSCLGTDDPFSNEYNTSIPAMVNAFVDFVGVVKFGLDKKHEHRFFSVE